MKPAKRSPATSAQAAGCPVPTWCARNRKSPTRLQRHEAKEAPTEEPKGGAIGGAEKGALAPWVLLPTFANNPKLGATSLGALAAYMRKFDAESQLSMFGASAQYTSTDSATLALFARTSFDRDHHRLPSGRLAA